MNQLIAVQVNEQEEQFMNQIIESKGSNLPEKIDDVVRVFEFSDLKAKAFKLIADKMLKLEEQNELYHSALRSSQKWSIASLYAQKRMGEITRDNKPEYSTHRDDGIPEFNSPRTKLGISEGMYKIAEQISNHPDILDQVIEHAQKNDEVPTKTAVLRAIKHKNDVERMESHNTEIKKKYDKKMVEQVSEAVKQYFDSLKGFKSILEISIIHAEGGKFSPESKNFIVKKHNEIKNLMLKMEETI